MTALPPKLPVSRLVPVVLAALALPAAAQDFEKDVLPILESHCIECHGDKKEKGDMNLEPHKISVHIGSGGAIRPGKANDSRLIKAILSDDPDVRMPPKGSRLSEDEVNTLKLWITRGAEVPKYKEPLAGTWTNTDGKEIEATLVGVDDEMAVLKLKNGKTTRYPIAKLSEESQAKIREWEESE